MKILPAVVVFLLVSVAASGQSTAGDFDDLFKEAPQCKQAAITITTLGGLDENVITSLLLLLANSRFPSFVRRASKRLSKSAPKS